MATRMDVLIDGDRSWMRCVERIEYAEAIDKLDAVVVEISVDRAEDADALVAAIVPGALFTVELIEDDAVITEGAGDVMEVRYHRRQRGGYHVTVVGLDGLHRLRGTQPATLWEVSHSDIVSEIASRHSLTAVADGVSTTPGFELQGDLGDAVFLRNLARENNYYVRVLADELHFARKEGAGTAVECAWGAEILELDLRASLDGMATKVTVHGYDPITDEVITGTAATTDLTNVSGGDLGADLFNTAFGASEIIFNQSGVVAATNATERAKAELQRRADGFVRGTLLVPGRPAAVSGLPLTVTGTGWPLAGTFLIRQTRHVMDPALGYRTYIDFMSDSLPAAS